MQEVYDCTGMYKKQPLKRRAMHMFLINHLQTRSQSKNMMCLNLRSFKSKRLLVHAVSRFNSHTFLFLVFRTTCAVSLRESHVRAVHVCAGREKEILRDETRSTQILYKKQTN